MDSIVSILVRTDASKRESAENVSFNGKMSAVKIGHADTFGACSVVRIEIAHMSNVGRTNRIPSRRICIDTWSKRTRSWDLMRSDERASHEAVFRADNAPLVRTRHFSVSCGHPRCSKCTLHSSIEIILHSKWKCFP